MSALLADAPATTLNANKSNRDFDAGLEKLKEGIKRSLKYTH